MMCLFVETKKIRNVQCCSSSGQQTATSSPSGTSGTTAPSTASNNATRLLQEDTCFECYKPTGSNRTIAGSFQCVLKDQCKQQSVFPAVCSTGLSCDTDKMTLCSKHGTCAPIDRDAPQGTYRCLCDVGFGGRFCDQVISNDCVGDCGVGGTCVSGQCVCNVGYTGDQCMGCTRNQTCNSDKLAGSCNLKTNTCDCNPGYQGDKWCGTTSDVTTTIDTCTTTSRPDCGTQGICLQSQCFCRNGACVGSSCTKCTLPGCVDCVASDASPVGLSVALSGLFAVALWSML
ncbi:hypothetical protein AC1031_007732 [Aphanomyces cochlioides]|nr:hypothetical protein AC1031_007732 [Aphanomyces cochlioides]